MASCSRSLTVPGRQLLKNPDFEEPLVGSWEGRGCQIERTDEASFRGRWCGKVSGRRYSCGSASQTVTDVEGGQNYYFTAWIKVLTPGSHTLKCMAQVQLSGGCERVLCFSTSPYMRPERGWTQVGGDFLLPQGAVSVRLYVQFGNVSVAYLIDHASLTLIPVNPRWQQDAQERIDDIRKQNLTINVDCGEYDPADVEVEVSLYRHAFAFGSAIRADLINGNSPSNRRYQQVFYDNFEWAVFANAMKWKEMEFNKDKMKFKNVDDAIARLKEKDVTYWDVNNEQLHHNFFETKTGMEDVMSWMFQQAQSVDREARLMLNDYNIVSGGWSTVAIVSSARYLLTCGAPVHAIGVQSHFQSIVDPHLLNARFDMLAQAGLPLWVTEMDINIPDELTKAKSYETALTVIFSRPEVDGLLVWGFWDQAHWRPQAAMWTGPDIKPNASGQKWIELVKRKWRTHEILRPVTRQQTFKIRAFQGVYDVTIRVKGQVICQGQKYVVPKGKDTCWDIVVEPCLPEEEEGIGICRKKNCC